MISTTLGNIGHISVIVAFLTSILSAIGFWKTTNTIELDAQQSWRSFAKINFYIHAFAVLSIVVSLFLIIFLHQYQYQYAWSHSSNHLPVYYMISCFWEGQEGSFLLWIFWHVILASVLLFTNKQWQSSTMMVFMAVQTFLVSMIIGVVVPFIEYKIGSSPFILMKESMPHLPVYTLNPDFVADEGNGLNPLLQNYWMVIHPPTLFLGFALTLVPFAFCIGGLSQGLYKEWIRPALPWALFAAVILGIGIMMGAYWAYETLNFGGYWNWDPVENAVYVPWLILVAAIHLMVVNKSSGTALKWSIWMVIASFILILYSTFLTRSGILGNASVHSFTDLGMSGQLVLYMFFFLFVAIYYYAINSKNLPQDNLEESSPYSREFWMFIGVLVLSIAAFQVLATTSIPVYNALAKAISIELNLAPPAKPEVHYSLWQMGFAIMIALLSGVGQFFWWNKMDKKVLWDAIYIPLVLSVLVTALILLLGVLEPYVGETIGYGRMIGYILLLTTSIFSIVSNIVVFFKIVRNNYKLTGGAVAHIGLAFMLIGILFSAGYSKVVSLNTTGLLYNKEFDVETNRDNLLLFRDTPEKMKDLQLLYKGQRMEVEGWSEYVDKDILISTEDPYKAILKQTLDKDKVGFRKGDTVAIQPENTYYEIAYTKAAGDTFTLFPRIQQNAKMGSVVSPDVKSFVSRDLYSHLSAIPLKPDEREWSETQQYEAKMGDTLFINDYIVLFKHLDVIHELPGVELDKDDYAVVAHLLVLGPNQKNYPMHPTLVIQTKKNELGSTNEMNEALGLRISLTNIKPETNSFVFDVNTCQKDYIILKAIEKPGINLLWIGTLLVVIGTSMATYRRAREYLLVKNKED